MTTTKPRPSLADMMDLDLLPWLDGALDADAACEFLMGISRRTLSEHVRAGRLRQTKLGNRIGFSRKDLAELLAQGANP